MESSGVDWAGPRTRDPERAAYLARLFDRSALHLGPQPGGQLRWRRKRGGEGNREGGLVGPVVRDREYLKVACDCGEQMRRFPRQAVIDGDCRWRCPYCKQAA